MAQTFKGKIELDIRDSKPDWNAFLENKAPKGAPNVLVILYDDTGQAAWSPYGGRIEMPTLDKLAKNGLTYTQWHTTAVCSPTRSCFLTGRNHHQNGFGSIARVGFGLSRLCGPHPHQYRHHGERAARCRLVDLLGGQEPQCAGRCLRHGIIQKALATGARL